MAMWTQFRRLLLGTVIEAMLEERVAVDFNTIDINFDRSKSVFNTGFSGSTLQSLASIC